MPCLHSVTVRVEPGYSWGEVACEKAMWQVLLGPPQSEHCSILRAGKKAGKRILSTIIWAWRKECSNQYPLCKRWAYLATKHVQSFNITKWCCHIMMITTSKDHTIQLQKRSFKGLIMFCVSLYFCVWAAFIALIPQATGWTHLSYHSHSRPQAENPSGYMETERTQAWDELFFQLVPLC